MKSNRSGLSVCSLRFQKSHFQVTEQKLNTCSDSTLCPTNPKASICSKKMLIDIEMIWLICARDLFTSGHVHCIIKKEEVIKNNHFSLALHPHEHSFPDHPREVFLFSMIRSCRRGGTPCFGSASWYERCKLTNHTGRHTDGTNRSHGGRSVWGKLMSQGTIRRQARWDKREAKGHKTAKCDPKSRQANADLQNQTTSNGQRYETKETVSFPVFNLTVWLKLWWTSSLIDSCFLQKGHTNCPSSAGEQRYFHLS